VGQSPERSARVSTLELFFDLVFVFTITQLTGILAAGQDLTSAAQVVVLLLLIWWMYDGYAWLTNAIETERVRYRLLLMGGMGSFLVIALAAPYAFGERGLAFGLAYLIVVLLHSGMFVQGTSLSEIRAVLQLAPFNLIGAGLVLFGGATGGSAQWVMWIAAAVLFWAVTPWLTSVEGFLVSPTHFVERHGLVIIIALGESVVVIGVGAAGMQLDANLVLVVLLALALAAALWWTYFRDESDVQRAIEEAPPRRRNKLALVAFGYWHYGLLLGVVLVAAGLKKAVAVPYDPLDGWIAGELAGGVALFLVCDVGFRRTLGIPRGGGRFAAAPVCLLTIPLGTQMAGVAQVGALAAIVAGALVVEGSRVPPRREPMVAGLSANGRAVGPVHGQRFRRSEPRADALRERR
jgi:low temperature requirement protein LtrA